MYGGGAGLWEKEEELEDGLMMMMTVVVMMMVVFDVIMVMIRGDRKRRTGMERIIAERSEGRGKRK